MKTINLNEGEGIIITSGGDMALIESVTDINGEPELQVRKMTLSDVIKAYRELDDEGIIPTP